RRRPSSAAPKAALAQLVEHRIRNAGVRCSSHLSGTTFFRAASGRKPSRDGRRGPSAWELRGYEVSAPAVGRRHGGINLIVQLQNARDYTGMVQYAFGGGERWFGRIMTNSPRRSITLCRQSW